MTKTLSQGVFSVGRILMKMKIREYATHAAATLFIRDARCSLRNIGSVIIVWMQLTAKERKSILPYLTIPSFTTSLLKA